MSSYFDDHQVQKRIGRQYRRRFVYRVHMVLTVLLLASIYYFHYYTLSLRYAISFGEQIIAVSLIVAAPLILHYLWLRYRENMEAAVDREIKTAYEYRKHMYSNNLPLSDDSELWQDEAFPQEKRKRLME